MIYVINGKVHFSKIPQLLLVISEVSVVSDKDTGRKKTREREMERKRERTPE